MSDGKGKGPGMEEETQIWPITTGELLAEDLSPMGLEELAPVLARWRRNRAVPRDIESKKSSHSDAEAIFQK